jgi:glucose/arabinose dehydrogenase
LTIVFVLVALLFVGSAGVGGACKLYYNCGTGTESVSNFRGQGAGDMALPADLKVGVYVQGFVYPTDLAFLPDGKLLVAEKDGLIDIVAGAGKQPAPFLDLSPVVNTAYFRGIMNLEVDPDFAAHPYVYVTYTAIGQGATSKAPTVVRVSRFTVRGDTASRASEHVILGSVGTTSCLSLPPSSNCLPSEVDHDGGDIAFAPDGTLFVSTGDGGGQEHVEQAALLAQSIDTLGGKILHVDRDGNGLSDNPFWDGNPKSNRSRVWALGVRNPFRMTLLPGSPSTPVVADVGWNTWERIVLARRGANLGWPCYEAAERTAQYRDTPLCTAFYRTHPVAPTPAWVAFKHPAAESITGGVFLDRATALPSRYRGDYLFADWSQSWMSLLPTSTAAQHNVAPERLAKNAAGPDAFVIGPDGALYYLAANLGEVRRVAGASG